MVLHYHSSCSPPLTSCTVKGKQQDAGDCKAVHDLSHSYISDPIPQSTSSPLHQISVFYLAQLHTKGDCTSAAPSGIIFPSLSNFLSFKTVLGVFKRKKQTKLSYRPFYRCPSLSLFGFLSALSSLCFFLCCNVFQLLKKILYNLCM